MQVSTVSCLSPASATLAGTRLSLHQDREGSGLGARPLDSVSLGLQTVCFFGGLQRSDHPTRWRMAHSGVVVWGSASRLAFRGEALLDDGDHPRLGRQRINLTFRHAA